MEPEVVNSEMLLPPVLPFKRVQMSDKYPKGHARGRHWKHLKQILQAENYASYPADEPNCTVHRPRTNLRYANPDVFKRIRMLPDDHVQRYLA
ncbi:protein EIN6 ENHANCER-like [Elaeis guineensis]|uniref:protein EIN6 ENHANCER-like n=1 Tax=Elaeis guineensis var. tenera TaxID=51953 RepID=UPI003C6D680A